MVEKISKWESLPLGFLPISILRVLPLWSSSNLMSVNIELGRDANNRLNGLSWIIMSPPKTPLAPTLLTNWNNLYNIFFATPLNSNFRIGSRNIDFSPSHRIHDPDMNLKIHRSPILLNLFFMALYSFLYIIQCMIIP